MTEIALDPLSPEELRRRFGSMPLAIARRLMSKRIAKRPSQKAWRRRDRKVNPDKYALAKHTRRAQMAGGKVTVNEWQAIIATHGGKCAYCGIALERPTIDHVVALSNGGTHTPDNVVPACLSCNSRKGARLLRGRPLTR